MNLFTPLTHKCPKCNSDLYTQFKGRLFESVFIGKYISCKRCSSNLSWKKSVSLYLVRLSFFSFFVFAALFPVVGGVLGFEKTPILIHVGILAVAGVVFLINSLFLEITIKK